MNEQKIHELLQRYFDGETSLDEERKLQRYFAEEEIPDSLMVYRQLFTFFAEEQAVMPPVHKPLVRLNWAIITGIAASIAILFLIGLPKVQHEQYVYYVDGHRIYDETAAMELAGDKLQMLATSMQKAQSSMAAFGKVQESNRSLQQFGRISDAYRQMENVEAKLQEFVNN